MPFAKSSLKTDRTGESIPGQSQYLLAQFESSAWIKAVLPVREVAGALGEGKMPSSRPSFEAFASVRDVVGTERVLRLKGVPPSLR